MRRGVIPPQASRDTAGVLGKPPLGSRIPASRCVEVPHRCDGIAFGPSPAEKLGYGIVWVPSVRFYPLGLIGLIEYSALPFDPIAAASLNIADWVIV